MQGYNLGTSGAETYALPTVAPEPVAPQQQPYDDGVRALEGLQYVKGQTEAYYKKVADLKSFMQGAHANLGVDVRVPDMSRPESIKLHQIYNDAITDILQTGNSLKQGNAIQSQLTNMRAQYKPGFNPQNQAMTGAVQGEDYWFGLQDIVKENNDFQQQAHDTGNIEEATQKYDETKKYLESQKNGKNDAAIDYQIRGLVPPRSVKDRTFAQRSTWQEKKYKGQLESAGASYSKILHLSRGAADSFKAEPEVTGLTPEGNAYLISREFQGTKIGDSILDYWKQDPDKLDDKGNPTISLVFKDGSERTVSARDAVDLTSQLTGTEVDNIMTYLNDRGKLDSNSQVNVEKVLNPNYTETVKKNLKLAKSPEAVAKEANKLTEEKLLNMKTTGWFLPNQRIDAGKYKIMLNSDGFKIENIKTAGTTLPKYNAKGADKDRAKYLKTNETFPQTEQGIKALMKFLNENGAVVETYRANKSKEAKPRVDNSVQPGTNVAPTKPTVFDPTAY